MSRFMMTILFALVALLSLLAGTADACLKYRATWNKAKDEFDVALIDDNFTVCEANNWRIAGKAPKDIIYIPCVHGYAAWVYADQSEVHYRREGFEGQFGDLTFAMRTATMWRWYTDVWC